jgi:ATP-binding cassette subfamily B protein
VAQLIGGAVPFDLETSQFVIYGTILLAVAVLGTVLSLIRVARVDPLDAMAKASAMGIVERTPQGLDVTIGENGMKLSGGERQRIAIARALLRRPELLIFDEATSALDSLTEDEITETVKEVSLSGERITILIAHRLSTIMHANRIYVLERGRIVEHGDHDSLLALTGLYYAMWRQQIGER